MIVTFYSYKGGVGRSMALANVAQWYRQQGLRVVMIDWDLEAPGLECFFTADRTQREAIQGKLGLVDLLATYRTLFPGLSRDGAKTESDDGVDEDFVDLLGQVLPPLKHVLVPIDVPPAGARSGGALWLLTAGCRSGSNFDTYAETVQRFDWDQLYSEYEGESYFEWLRRQLLDTALADVVLIDSRTGVAEMSGVCTRQLADVVVLFSAPNDQNLDGVANMARSFTRKELLATRGGRSIELVMVPSRIHEAEGRPIDLFQSKFRERLSAYLPETFRHLGTGFEKLRIPYISAYAFSERLAIGDPNGVKALQQAYETLAIHIALLAPNDSSLRQGCATQIDKAFGLTKSTGAAPPWAGTDGSADFVPSSGERVNIVDPKALSGDGEAGAFPLDLFERVCLAQGDSWFSIGSIPPTLTTNLLAELHLARSTMVVNCAAPQTTLAHSANTATAPYFLRLLVGRMAMKWDAILFSGGGSDLIDALGADPQHPPHLRLLLTPAERHGDDYISEAGWKTLEEHLRVVFSMLIEQRDSGVNRSVPICFHNYAPMVPRNAPGGLRMGPWLHPAFEAYKVPVSDRSRVVAELFTRLSRFLERLFDEQQRRNPQANLHLVDTQSVVLAAANELDSAVSGDWQNEIHPTQPGYRKLASRWAEVLDAVLG